MRTATFFGGCVPASPQEEELARGIGRRLGQAGFVLRHGGYNGLMEHAAQGAAATAAAVEAVTLAGADWGPFNPYVASAERAPDMGARLAAFLDDTDLVIAMGGGVGTLHELTAALWYAGNLRPVPVWIAGATALCLLDFLQEQRWVYESPTRPLGFLRRVPDETVFETELTTLLTGATR